MFFRCDILSVTRALLLGTPLIPVEGDSALARRILGLVDCRLSYALVCTRRCIVGGADTPAHLSLVGVFTSNTPLFQVVSPSPVFFWRCRIPSLRAWVCSSRLPLPLRPRARQARDLQTSSTRRRRLSREFELTCCPERSGTSLLHVHLAGGGLPIGVLPSHGRWPGVGWTSHTIAKKTEHQIHPKDNLMYSGTSSSLLQYL